MDSDDGAAAQQPQPTAEEQTAGEGEASRSGGSRRRRRTSQPLPQRQLTYAQVAASWARRRSAPPGGSFGSGSSGNGNQGSQAAEGTLNLSRSAKKRRKRLARKNSSREVTGEHPETAQPYSKTAKDEEGDPGTEQAHASSTPTQTEAPKRDEASTGSVTSTREERSQPGDGQGELEVAQIMTPGTSTYIATFPSIEEIRARFRASSHSGASQTTRQAGHQKQTTSSTDTVQGQDDAGSQEDTSSEKSSLIKGSNETESSVSHSKPETAAFGGGDDQDENNADEESSVETGSFRSSVDMNEVFDINFTDITRERDREEYIMLMVSKCALMVSDMTGEFTAAIKDIFGYWVVPLDGAGPSNADASNGISHAVSEDVYIPEYNLLHEQRLEGLRVYVYKTAQNPDGSEIVEELEGSGTATGSYEPSEMTTEEEIGTSSREETADEEPRCKSTEGEQAAQSSNQKESTASEQEKASRRRALVLRNSFDIHAFAEMRAYKMKNSCKNLYSGLVALINIISLSLEAYKGVQQAVEHVIRPPYAAINGLVAEVTDAAIGASERLHITLSDAERAARIHFASVRTLAELDKLMAMLGENGPFTADIPDKYATLENVLSVLQRSSTFVNLDWIKTKDTAAASASAVPSTSHGAAAPSAQSEEGWADGRPSEGFEALLLGTRSAVAAVETAMTSLDVIYAAEVSVRGEEEETSSDD